MWQVLAGDWRDETEMLDEIWSRRSALACEGAGFNSPRGGRRVGVRACLLPFAERNRLESRTLRSSLLLLPLAFFLEERLRDDLSLGGPGERVASPDIS